ncbi:MAG: metallophosphoesterase [Novosphingobium sp.]|nr:metallophosphoesterase [Novosphingobium sp.]
MRRVLKSIRRAILASAIACALASGPAVANDKSFTIAVIPDTQGYTDYTHQKAEGFPFDAGDMFLQQMRYIASNVESEGGDIAFVTSLGDVWQHQTLLIDPAHEARGFRRTANPLLDVHFAPSDKVRSVEMPIAHRGFALLDGKVPFSVVPGNHDYDAMWTDADHPPAATISLKDLTTVGLLHAGGLANFTSVFGKDSAFFRDKDWYVDSYGDGASSAQIFTAGGYRFLHIGLQFEPPNGALEWASGVIGRYPGLPTIVSTHSYLDTQGRRLPNPVIDNARVDPDDNSPEMMWDKFVSRHDQIFMVLCGHNNGQALRVDNNRFGHKVYQILSDYQERRQTAINAGGKLSGQDGIGDGWIRLMKFNLNSATPKVIVQTYSTHYGKKSIDMDQYARFYKSREGASLSDEDFHNSDNFMIYLDDFIGRFNQK